MKKKIIKAYVINFLLYKHNLFKMYWQKYFIFHHDIVLLLLLGKTNKSHPSNIFFLLRFNSGIFLNF